MLLRKILPITLIMALLVACKQPITTVQSTQYVQSSIKGDFTVKLNDETLSFYIPEGMFDVKEGYLKTLSSTYNIESQKYENLICLGNDEDLFKSVNAITAAPISTTKEIYNTLYGDTFDADTVAYSTAYRYMTTGRLPSDAPDNYKINELESITVGDLTYRTFSVSYDTSYDKEDGAKGMYSTVCLTAYTNTGLDDDMEIIIYLEEWNDSQAIRLLKEFLGVN